MTRLLTSTLLRKSATLLLALALYLTCTHVEARVYDGVNDDGLTATFVAEPINGNYNSGGNSATCSTFKLPGNKRMTDPRHGVVYEIVPEVGFRFDVINNVGDTVTGHCNGTSYVAHRVSGKRFKASVEDAIHAIGTERLVECCWDGHVVVAGRRTPAFSPPQLEFVNPPIYDDGPENGLQWMIIPAGGNLSYDMNVSYFLEGYCESDADSIIWALPPNPNHIGSLISFAGQYVHSLEAGEKRCFFATDQFAEGDTKIITSGSQTVGEDEILVETLGQMERIVEVFLDDEFPGVPLDGLLIEWNTRTSDQLTRAKFGRFRDVHVHTDFVNPCPEEQQVVCKRTDPMTGPWINATRLYEVSGGSSGLFACDPAYPFNGPEILKELGDPICDEYNRDCSAVCSKDGSLGWLDNIMLAPGFYSPSLSSVWDFAQYYFNPFNATQRFIGLCNLVFGPLGLSTSDGFQLRFNMRRLTQKERDHIDRPLRFPGYASDEILVNQACEAAAIGSGQVSPIPQPNTAHFFGTTVLGNPEDPTLTIWGVPPAALEDADGRAFFDDSYAARLDGRASQSVTGGWYLHVCDTWYGALAGDTGIYAAVKFQWQLNQANVDSYITMFHFNDTLPMGPCGGHGGFADQDDTFAHNILTVQRAHDA